MNIKLLCILTLSVLMTAACSSTAKKDAAGADRDSANRGLSSGLVSKSGLPPVLYFEFDSTDIKAQDLASLDKWGALLKANPLAKARLEGHADERGTPEYNTALGERRANAVRDALIQRGAKAQQLMVLSYGESKPVDTSHSQMAWNLNRRVEIVDIN